ncbi:MAG: patatin-like phospholipase family protein [Nitrospirae bacterium]|nr:patatin-like phospholipase family protein [Nitrospirota bacterium]
MQRVGVVLSTGDLSGVFAHTGFLSALEEMGISYQAMAGSSAGVIVASIVAGGKDPKDFAEWLKGLKVSDYWERDSTLAILYNVIVRRGRGYTGIVSTDRLEHTIAGLLKAKTFEDCLVPLYLVATNLTKGTKEVFHSGEITPRAVASAAIPVLVKAKRIDDSYYVDGGVYELTPRSAICCREKLDVLIVNEIKTALDRTKGDNQFLQERWSLVHLVGRVLDAIYEKERVEGREDITACPCGCAARIVTLSPRLDAMDRLKPHEGMRLLRQGYEETLRLLPPLLKSVASPPAQPAPKEIFPCD